jgi:hypothetical protein
LEEINTFIIEWCGKLNRSRDRTELCKQSPVVIVCLCGPGVDGSGISNMNLRGNDTLESPGNAES